MPSFALPQFLFAGLDFRHGRLFDTRDAGEAQTRLGQVFSPHALRVLDDGARFHAWADHLPFGSLSMNRLAWHAPVAVDPGALLDYYLLCFPLPAHIEYLHGRELRRAGPGDLAVVGGGERFHFTAAVGYEQLVLRIERQAVETAWTALAGTVPRAPICFYNPDSEWTVSALAPALGLLTGALRGEFDGTALRHLDVRLQDLLLTTLLLQHPHSARPTAIQSVRSNPACLRKAKAFLLERLEEPMSLIRLSEGIGVPGRTLQAAFQASDGLGPMQWLRARRLEGVRAALLEKNGAPPRVAATALRFGFTHLGEFTQHYRRAFGETPSQTLGRRT